MPERYDVDCWPLNNPETVLIGRGQLCDIILSSCRVSRLHACIFWMSDHYRIKDMQSKNGTHVNGRMVKSSEHLCHCDEIQLGLCCKFLFVDTAQFNICQMLRSLQIMH